MDRKYNLAKLISSWQRGDSTLEIDSGVGVELAAMFDSDYEYHLLFREWNNYDKRDLVHYSLWFLGIDRSNQEDICCLVKRWSFDPENSKIPYVEAAEIVEDWIQLSIADIRKTFGY
jgi:hypothetical protein